MPSPTQEAPAETTASAAPSSSGGPLRFSLRTLIIGVTITAVACLAFRFANPLWASVFLTIQLGLTIAAIILAIYGDPRHRAWRVGFVITATILCLFCWLEGVQGFRNYDSSFPVVVPGPLAFRHVTERTYYLIYGDAIKKWGQYDRNPGVYFVPSISTPLPPSIPPLHYIHHVADPLWILSLASIGGCFAAWLDARRRELPQAS